MEELATTESALPSVFAVLRCRPLELTFGLKLRFEDCVTSSCETSGALLDPLRDFIAQARHHLIEAVSGARAENQFLIG